MHGERARIEYSALICELDTLISQKDMQSAAAVLDKIGRLCESSAVAKSLWAGDRERYSHLIRNEVAYGSLPRAVRNMWGRIAGAAKSIRESRIFSFGGVWGAAKRFLLYLWSWTSYPSWSNAYKSYSSALELPSAHNLRRSSMALKIAVFDTAMTALFAYLTYDFIRDMRMELEDMRVVGMTGTVLTRAIMHKAALAFLAKGGAMAAANAMIETEREAEDAEHVISFQRELLGRYLSPAVAERVGGSALASEERQITVVFTDVRGFTSLSSRINPALVVELLNRQFNVINDIVFQYEGTMCKYIGDSAMFMFNAPFNQVGFVDRAVAASIDIQRAMLNINRSLQGEHGFQMPLGIGIATGPVVVGSIGSHRYMDYTPIGDTVNLASRLNGVAGPGEIVVDRGTVERSSRMLDARAMGLKLRRRKQAIKFGFSGEMMHNLKGKGAVPCRKVVFRV